jgi:hypothetical protein
MFCGDLIKILLTDTICIVYSLECSCEGSGRNMLEDNSYTTLEEWHFFIISMLAKSEEIAKVISQGGVMPVVFDAANGYFGSR